MPFFLPYICLMFPVFVARLYWLVSTVSHIITALASLRLVSVLFVYLIIFLVSPSKLSLSVFSFRTWLWTLALLTTSPPALCLCTTALCLSESTHACPPDQLLDIPYTPVYWLSTSGLLHSSVGLNKPLFAPWTVVWRLVSVRESWHNGPHLSIFSEIHVQIYVWSDPN